MLKEEEEMLKIVEIIKEEMLGEIIVEIVELGEREKKILEVQEEEKEIKFFNFFIFFLEVFLFGFNFLYDFYF